MDLEAFNAVGFLFFSFYEETKRIFHTRHLAYNILQASCMAFRPVADSIRVYDNYIFTFVHVCVVRSVSVALKVITIFKLM